MRRPLRKISTVVAERRASTSWWTGISIGGGTFTLSSPVTGIVAHGDSLLTMADTIDEWKPPTPPKPPTRPYPRNRSTASMMGLQQIYDNAAAATDRMVEAVRSGRMTPEVFTDAIHGARLVAESIYYGTRTSTQ